MSGLFDISEPVKMNESQIDKVAVGIDFGTTNSLICLINQDDTIFFGDKNGILIPSVVAIHKDHDHVHVGHEAVRLVNDENYAVLYSIKSLIGFDREIKEGQSSKNIELRYNNSSNIPDLIIFGKTYQVTEIISYIITYLKVIAEDEMGKKIDSCVITVPARFDDLSRNIIKSVTQSCGMEVMRIINEPTAAALAYGLDRSSEGIYGVYDLGGGTFDVSILRMKMGVFQVIHTAGDTNLGGDDLDKILIELIKSKASLDDLLISKEEIKLIKHRLYDQKNIDIALGKDKINLTRDEFEKATNDILEKTIEIMKSAIDESKKEGQFLTLNGIILVGGSTRIPLIKEKILKIADCPVFDDADPDKTVAIGAAIKARDLSYKSSSGVLIDVVPLSIGIEVFGGLVEKLIHRNTPIPISVSQDFTTFKDNQSSIDIHILQGERPGADDCRSLGRFKFPIERGKAGSVAVTISFSIDVDNILTVTAIDKKTGLSREIEVNPTYDLNFDKAKEMLISSVNNKNQDNDMFEYKKTLADLEKTIEESLEIIKNIECDTLKEKEITELCIQSRNLVSEKASKDEIIKAKKAIDILMEPINDKVSTDYLSRFIGKNYKDLR